MGLASTEDKQFRRAGMVRVFHSLENCQIVVESLAFQCVVFMLRTKHCGEIVAPNQ